MSFESALLSLSNEWGISLDINANALVIKANDGSHWHLEKPKSSQVFTLYSPFENQRCHQSDCKFWLSLNADRNRLGSAWIAILDNSICIGITLPKDLIDACSLVNLFENLHSLKEDLANESPNTSHYSTISINPRRDIALTFV